MTTQKLSPEETRAAILCRYPIEASGLQTTKATWIYFLAEDIDFATSLSGMNVITDCEAVEIVAVI
jgi:hypothetical protein